MTFISWTFQCSNVWKAWRSLAYSSKKTQLGCAVVIPYVRVKQLSWKNTSQKEKATQLKKHQITEYKKEKLDYSHEAKINSKVSAGEAGQAALGVLLPGDLLVPRAATVALPEAGCAPRSPFHINNISYNSLLPGAQRSSQAVKTKPPSCSRVTLKFLSSWPISCFPLLPPPLLPWQREAALWQDTDNKFTGLQLFLLKAKSNPFYIFLLTGKPEPEQLSSNFNIP